MKLLKSVHGGVPLRQVVGRVLGHRWELHFASSLDYGTPVSLARYCWSRAFEAPMCPEHLPVPCRFVLPEGYKHSCIYIYINSIQIILFIHIHIHKRLNRLYDFGCAFPVTLTLLNPARLG